MKKNLVTTFVLYAAIILNNGLEAKSSIQLVEESYKNGKINIEDKLVLQIQAIFSSERLPAEYKGEKETIKCFTPLLLEIRRNWDILSEKTKKEFQSLFLRPTDPTYYVPKVTETINLAYTVKSVYYDTANFRIHYVTSTVDAPDLTDLNGNAIPDYVETVGKVFEYVYSFVVYNLGYKKPPEDGMRGGDSKYDVYLKEIEKYKVLGWADPEGPTARGTRTYYSFIVIDNDYSKYGLDILKVTASHEYFHAIQFGYDAIEDDWWMEATATWMEDEVYDDINDYVNYLNGVYYRWFDYPDKSLNHPYGLHKYGSSIFCKYLTERQSGSWGAGIIKEIWEGCIGRTQSIDAIDSVLKAKGTSLEKEFSKFTVCNFIEKPAVFIDDKYTYADDAAVDYPDIKIIKTYNAAGENQHYVPLTGTWGDSPSELPGLSAHYIKFLPPALLDKPSKIILKFKSGNPGSWGHKVILVRQDNKKEIYDLAKVGGTSEGTFRFGITKSNPQPDEIKEAVLVVSSLLTTQQARGYHYSATVVPQFIYVKNLLPSNVIHKGTVIKLEAVMSAPVNRVEADFSSIDTAFDKRKVSIKGPIIEERGTVYIISYPLSYTTTATSGAVKITAVTVVDRKEFINEDTSVVYIIGNVWDYLWDAAQMLDETGWVKQKVDRVKVSEQLQDSVFYIKLTGEGYIHYTFSSSFFKYPPFTIEFRVKHCVPQTVSSQVNSYAGINDQFVLGFLINAFGLDKVGLDYVEEPYPPEEYNNYFMETTDIFHTYRITFDNSKIVRVYIDNILRLQAKARSVAQPNSVFDIAFFSGYEGYWDYIAFKGGIAAGPDILPSPSVAFPSENLLSKTILLNNHHATNQSSFELKDVYCYPNPARNGKNPTFHIECDVADNVELKIYNIAGEIVHSVDLTKNLVFENNKHIYQYIWDVSDIPSGVYIYSVKAEKLNEKPIKIVKKLAIIK